MRLIDADKYIEEESEGTFLGDISIEKFNEITPTVEAYTKDEVIAMLTEIKDEASNIIPTIYNCASFTEGIRAYDKLIQQKINDLKKDKDE